MGVVQIRHYDIVLVIKHVKGHKTFQGFLERIVHYSQDKLLALSGEGSDGFCPSLPVQPEGARLIGESKLSAGVPVVG